MAIVIDRIAALIGEYGLRPNERHRRNSWGNTPVVLGLA
jgi:hypothetical protein